MKESLSIDELRGKQSVRTTFKLPKELIDVLGLAASQLGIKQKSLLDQLIGEVDLIEVATRRLETASVEKEVRPKTFVLSRNSLDSINKIARQQALPRDVVAELSIERLLPLMEEERDKQLQRKRLQGDFHQFFQQGLILLEEAGRALGENDLLYEILEKQVKVMKKHQESIDKIVEKGRPLEKW